MVKIASKLSDEQFDTRVTPVIVRLFSNPDRAIRVCLLDNLPSMIDHLTHKVVNDKIFPQMVRSTIARHGLSLMLVGDRLFGCSSHCPRADSQGSLDCCS